MKKVDLNRFGRNVRLIRERLGLSQAELAGRAGCEPGFISHLEKGKRSPSLDTLCQLVVSLRCSPSDLLSYVMDEKQKMYRVRLSALATVRGSVEVKASSPEESGKIAIDKSGDVEWGYDGVNDDSSIRIELVEEL
jgi:transcriptional regulator with XRE-family HTH domain